MRDTPVVRFGAQADIYHHLVSSVNILFHLFARIDAQLRELAKI
jgi:hypothetical protein